MTIRQARYRIRLLMCCRGRCVAARRGAAILIAVLVLVMVNLLVVGAVASQGDDAAISARRAQGLRARYALESAACVGAKQLALGAPVPTRTVSLPGSESYVIESVTDPGRDGPETVDLSVTGGFASVARGGVVVVSK